MKWQDGGHFFSKLLGKISSLPVNLMASRNAVCEVKHFTLKPEND